MDPRRTDSESEIEDDYYELLSQKKREQPEDHTRQYPMRRRRYLRHLTPDPYTNRYE